MGEYRSQFGQDRIVDGLFSGFRGGTFVELGGMDGLHLSNTYFLERSRGWSGLLVEPNPELYPKMVSNRPACFHENVAVAATPGHQTLRVPGAVPGLAGLETFYCDKHKRRIQSKNGGGLGACHDVRVERMASLLDRNGLREVHYMSIDVEGGEESVVDSIDFDACFVHLLAFESNYAEESVPILSKLQSLGFLRLPVQNLDVFMANRRSPLLRQSIAPALRLDDVPALAARVLTDKSVRDYRVGDVVMKRGFKWLESAREVLSQDRYRGTALRAYLEGAGPLEVMRPDWARLSRCLRAVADREGWPPGSWAVAVHVRSGDVIDDPRSRHRNTDKAVAQLRGFPETPSGNVVLVAKHTYGDYRERGLWEYSDEKRSAADAAFRDLAAALRRAFPDARLSVLSEGCADRHLWFMSTAKRFAPDFGGFSESAERIRREFSLSGESPALG
jgi:FkbM family methyltransferase